MVLAMEERIGGHLSIQLLSQVLEEMQSVPVINFSDMAFDQLDHRQDMRIESIWKCLDAWLGVGKTHPDRAWKDAELNSVQDASNLDRVAGLLDRTVPDDVKSWRGHNVNFAVLRVKSFESPQWLRDGFRGVDEQAVVVLPLQNWNINNGFFCVAEMSPGQDICLGGREEVQLSRNGGCLILVFFLPLPRRRGPSS
jgi:hypothetical protein